MKALVLDGDCARETADFGDVASSFAEGKRLWVELDGRSAEADKLLDEVFKIHPLAVEDVWNDLSLPKVEDFGDYVQLVLHGICEQRLDGEDSLSVSELDVVIGRNFVVTHTHDEMLSAITPVHAEILRNPRLLKRGPAWVAHAVLDRMVDAYIPVIDHFEDRIDEIEQRIFEGQTLAKERETIREVMRIKRSLQVLRRTTIYQREILGRLARAEWDEIPRESMPFYRDVYDHFARVSELVDSNREIVASLLDAHFSMQSNQMNEIMKRLTLISTIMLPLSLIAGIYGMNFKHDFPELEWEYGYYYALGLMGLIAAAIVSYFRFKRWL